MNSKPKVAPAKTKQEIDGDLGRLWVRMQLGRNRGEDRQYSYTEADRLLDERNAARG